MLAIEQDDCVGATFHSHSRNYPVRLFSESNRIERSKRQGVPLGYWPSYEYGEVGLIASRHVFQNYPLR